MGVLWEKGKQKVKGLSQHGLSSLTILLLYLNLAMASPGAEEGIAQAVPGFVEGGEEEANLTGALGG